MPQIAISAIPATPCRDVRGCDWDLPERKDGETADRPRQSYEFRCIFIDPNWTSPNKNVTGLAVEPSDEKARPWRVREPVRDILLCSVAVLFLAEAISVRVYMYQYVCIYIYIYYLPLSYNISALG